MNFSKEQKDYIIRALEHCEMLTGGKSSGKTLELIKQQNKEIERLNNIISELEKRCNEMLKLYDTFSDEQRFNNWKEYKVYDTILDWIEELKGDDKE